MRLDEFQNRLKEKLLIILSSTRLHYRVKEKGQTMDLSIITFKLKDIAIVQTHIIPLLRNNTSGNNILKTSILSYHQLKIVSFNQPAFMTFLKMEQLLLNIILDNNYEDELAYVFNVYKDDIDPMQVQTEAFSMSTMFQGSNYKNFQIS